MVPSDSSNDVSKSQTCKLSFCIAMDFNRLPVDGPVTKNDFVTSGRKTVSYS